jgi:hypothetical protein
VPEHIGIEIRCTKSKFVSFELSGFAHLRALPQTFADQENNVSQRAMRVPFPPARQLCGEGSHALRDVNRDALYIVVGKLDVPDMEATGT